MKQDEQLRVWDVEENRMLLARSDLHYKTEPREWVWFALRSPASGSAKAAPPVCAQERAQLTEAPVQEMLAAWERNRHCQHGRFSPTRKIESTMFLGQFLGLE